MLIGGREPRDVGAAFDRDKGNVDRVHHRLEIEPVRLMEFRGIAGRPRNVIPISSGIWYV